jgi:hypothetical protein
VLEATLLGKPTLCLNLSGEPDRYPYAEEGVSLAARNLDAIRQAVPTLRSFAPTAAWHERRRRFLVRHLGPTVTGGSAAAFARFLQEFIDARGQPIRYAHVPMPLALGDTWTPIACQSMSPIAERCIQR